MVRKDYSKTQEMKIANLIKTGQVWGQRRCSVLYSTQQHREFLCGNNETAVYQTFWSLSSVSVCTCSKCGSPWLTKLSYWFTKINFILKYIGNPADQRVIKSNIQYTQVTVWTPQSFSKAKTAVNNFSYPEPLCRYDAFPTAIFF